MVKKWRGHAPPVWKVEGPLNPPGPPVPPPMEICMCVCICLFVCLFSRSKVYTSDELCSSCYLSNKKVSLLHLKVLILFPTWLYFHNKISGYLAVFIFIYLKTVVFTKAPKGHDELTSWQIDDTNDSRLKSSFIFLMYSSCRVQIMTFKTVDHDKYLNFWNVDAISLNKFKDILLRIKDGWRSPAIFG